MTLRSVYADGNPTPHDPTLRPRDLAQFPVEPTSQNIRPERTVDLRPPTHVHAEQRIHEPVYCLVVKQVMTSCLAFTTSPILRRQPYLMTGLEPLGSTAEW